MKDEDHDEKLKQSVFADARELGLIVCEWGAVYSHNCDDCDILEILMDFAELRDKRKDVSV